MPKKLSYALLAVLLVSVAARLEAADEFVVEAAAGTPFGVAKVTPGDRLEMYRLNPRVRYIAGIQSSVILAQIEPFAQPQMTTIYFLFKGSDPFSIKLNENDTVKVTPSGDPTQHARLLKEWWGAYLATARHRINTEASSQSLMIYTAHMLGRRLKLAVPPDLTTNHGYGYMRNEGEIIGLFLGTESIRLALQEKTLLDVEGEPEAANQPLPTPVLPKAVEFAEPPETVVVEPMALHVPEECFYLRCSSFEEFRWLRTRTEEWGGSIRDIIAIRGRDYKVGEHLQRQLALKETALGKALGGLVIDDVALIGMDTFVREGSAIGIIFQAKNNAMLGGQLEKQRTEAAAEDKAVTLATVKIGGKDISSLTKPDNSVRSFYAVDGDFHLVTNSTRIVERFYEAGAGKGSLGKLKEFRSARNHAPAARKDPLFIYASDPFFRNLVGPAYRAEMTRRMAAEADLQTLEVARLAAMAEGFAAPTLEILTKEGFLPRGFGKRSDGSKPQIEAGKAAFDSLRGARGSLLPIPDVNVTKVTASEAAAYVRFSEMYQRMWERMDPVLSVVIHEMLPNGREKVVVDTHITPYVKQTYGMAAQFLGKPNRQALPVVEGDVLSLTAVLGKGDGFMNELPPFVFGSFQDFALPFAVVNGRLRTPYGADKPVGYLGVMAPEDLLKRIIGDEATKVKRDAEGYFEAGRYAGEFGRKSFGRYWENFLTIASSKELLKTVSPKLKLIEAERPAQIRLRMADLSETEISKIMNAEAYIRAHGVVSDNLRYLEELGNQFGLTSDAARAAGERLANATLVSPIGGAITFSPENSMWYSEGLGSALEASEWEARQFKFGLIQFVRGLSVEFRIDDTSLMTRVELELQSQAEVNLPPPLPGAVEPAK